MTRYRLLIALPVAALALVGASACGARTPQTASDQVEVAAELSPEGQALAALGFEPLDVAPTASAAPDKGARRARVLLRRNVLHGEAVVQTKEGAKTVAFQRGTVTAIDNASVTVKSTDGVTQTWKLADPLHVVEHRKAVAASAVKVGTQVGVAGGKEGSGFVARLIVVRAA